MNKHRPAAVTIATCAASLSLAACAVGTTTASKATSPAASSRSGPSVSVSASAPANLASRTIKVGGKVGSFPVPVGAKVAETIVSSQETGIIFDMITPAEVSSFYARALRQAGYTVTTNSVLSQSGNTAALIQFTGHGFTGNIDALSKFTDSTVSVAGLGHKNVTTITFTPK